MIVAVIVAADLPGGILDVLAPRPLVVDPYFKVCTCGY